MNNEVNKLNWTTSTTFHIALLKIWTLRAKRWKWYSVVSICSFHVQFEHRRFDAHKTWIHLLFVLIVFFWFVLKYANASKLFRLYCIDDRYQKPKCSFQWMHHILCFGHGFFIYIDSFQCAVYVYARTFNTRSVFVYLFCAIFVRLSSLYRVAHTKVGSCSFP